MRPTCGCGRPAEYLVYKHREPHCLDCLLEAIDCSGKEVSVFKPVDWGLEHGATTGSHREVREAAG